MVDLEQPHWLIYMTDGLAFRCSTATKEFLVQAKTDRASHVEICDLHEGRIVVIINQITSMVETSPAIREAAREFQKALDAERGFEVE